MDYFVLSIFIFMGYLIVYSLIGRICKCIEHCATAKAYTKMTCQSGMTADSVKDILNKALIKPE